MTKSEILHKFQYRARDARPYNVAGKSNCALRRRARRGAHCAPAFCAAFAFCSTIVKIRMEKKRIGQLSRQFDGDKDRDCKNRQHGQRQIGRDFVKADAKIVNPVFHADAALGKARINFVAHGIGVAFIE